MGFAAKTLATPFRFEGTLRGMLPTLAEPAWSKPDIIEWVCSDRYLNRGQTLYPRQATLLKLMFLAQDLMTDYDLDVLGEWSEGFKLPEPGQAPVTDGVIRFEPVGGEAIGITPDWKERMDTCIAEGRPWFREVQPIVGRRGSKGHIGAIAASRVLGEFISMGDPQDHFGISRDKQLTLIVFAGKKEQAKVNQWRDIVNVILGSPYLSQFASKPLSESLSVYAPADARRRRELERQGVETDIDLATFSLVPRESTLMAGRGPAAFALLFDEMAHLVSTGVNGSAEAVYESSVPALDQFGAYGFVYTASSPWQMTGKLYENYQDALSVDAVTGQPVRPDMLMVQLASWDLYKDWQYASSLPLVPGDHKRTFTRSKAKVYDLSAKREAKKVKQVDEVIERTSEYAGRTFEPLKGAIQEYDDQMKRLERANPDTFRVERRSQWQTALSSYLDKFMIERMFGLGGGYEPLAMKRAGVLSIDYYAHADPSEVNDNFGFVIGHRVGPNEDGLYGVEFDLIHAWQPQDFSDGRIDYLQVQKEIVDMGKAFNPVQITFDQFGGPGLIQKIDSDLNRAGLPKRATVFKKAATAALNWQVAETFKTALNMGLLRAPYHELLELELRFLQKPGTRRVDHPTSGPVQSKDVYDAASRVAYELIGEQMGAFLKGDLASTLLSGSQPGPAVDARREVVAAMGVGMGRQRPHGPRPAHR